MRPVDQESVSTVEGRTLLTPSRSDPERDAVADAWTRAGGDVVRLDRFWEPPAVARPALYGPDTFCLVVAERLGLALISPSDDLLAAAPHEALRRSLRAAPRAEVLAGEFPVFAKPLAPKQFRAGVWRDAASLAAETRGLAGDVAVVVGEVVSFACEVRAFVLDGVARTAAVYEGGGDLRGAREWLARWLPALALPEAVAVDVGWIEGRGWALLEANAAWGAGLNGCDASEAVAVIARATRDDAPLGSRGAPNEPRAFRHQPRGSGA